MRIASGRVQGVVDWRFSGRAHHTVLYSIQSIGFSCIRHLGISFRTSVFSQKGIALSQQHIISIQNFSMTPNSYKSQSAFLASKLHLEHVAGGLSSL